MANKNENMNHLMAKLNSATKNADFNQLEKDIQILKPMVDKISEICETSYYYLYFLDLHIEDNPSIEKIKSALQIRLQNLETIRCVLQSIKEITIDQLLSDLPEEEVINGWYSSLSSEPELSQDALTEEQVQDTNLRLENYGEAGVLQIGINLIDKIYIEEDEDVFDTMEEILGIVFESQDLEVEVNLDSKYWQDPGVQKMKAFVDEYNEEGININHYFFIWIDTDPVYVNEKIWKARVAELKESYLNENFLW